jgi:hypothetical protein
MPSINGVDFNNISSLNGVSWNSVMNISGVPVSHSLYAFYSLDTSNSSVITNTTNNTLYSSTLIPSGTFTTGGVLECIFKIAKTGSASTTPFYTWRIYKNTSNSLTGATLLITGAGNTSTNIRYEGTIRYFSLSGGQIIYLGTPASSLNDFSTSSNNIGTTSFNLSVDNYILLAIQPAQANSDTFFGTYKFIRGYE